MWPIFFAFFRCVIRVNPKSNPELWTYILALQGWNMKSHCMYENREMGLHTGGVSLMRTPFKKCSIYMGVDSECKNHVTIYSRETGESYTIAMISPWNVVTNVVRTIRRGAIRSKTR